MKIFKGDNSISFEASLKEKIAKILNRLYSGQDVIFSDTKLLIGVPDTNVLNSLTNIGFAATFQVFVSDNYGFNFHEVELVNHIEDGWTLVDEQYNIRFIVINQANHIRNCIHGEISIYKERGSLSEKIYYLEAKEQSPYYIGRGGDKRENDIVVENTPTSKYWEMNKYVRSAHAHITYQESDGFLLWADRDGTAAFGSRTRIIRKGEQNPIDLTNEYAPQILNDSDIIELGKHVRLLFKLVTSK